MELLTAFIVMLFPLIVFTVKQSRIGNVLFYFSTFYIGITIFLEGLTFSGTMLLTAYTAGNTVTWLLFMLMGFGSLYCMISSAAADN